MKYIKKIVVGLMMSCLLMQGVPVVANHSKNFNHYAIEGVVAAAIFGGYAGIYWIAKAKIEKHKTFLLASAGTLLTYVTHPYVFPAVMSIIKWSAQNYTYTNTTSYNVAPV